MKKEVAKRKICFVITSFIHYSRNLLILEELKKRADVDLHIVIGGTAVMSRYTSKSADIKKILTEEGYKNLYELHFNVEGNNSLVKAKTTGLGIIEFTTIFSHIKPDVVIVRGDRFEVLAATISAAYMSIPVAHIEGGDISGSIDESVRHAITKLSHIHFATNEQARQRILRLGENKDYVFNFGSPDVEVIDRLSKKPIKFDPMSTGSGASIDIKKTYVIVMYHPDLGDVEHIHENTKKILEAVHELGVQALWFWPNMDAGAEDISHELRVFNDEVRNHKIRFMRYLGPKEFIYLLKNSLCLVGNSSAGIKESSFIGLPVVDIGNRQQSRLHSENVINVGHDVTLIKKAIDFQIKKGRYKQSKIYLGSNTAKKIAKIVATVPLYIQKRFVE